MEQPLNSSISMLPIYKNAIQLLAASSSIVLRRDWIGLTRDALKKALNAKSDQEINDFILVSNMRLEQETIPAKIIYDDIVGRYIYVQAVHPSILINRLKTGTLLLFMLIYYNQITLGHPSTSLRELLEIIDSSVTDKPDQKIANMLQPLIDYCLVKEEKETQSYKVTCVGETFMTPILLKRLTDVTMSQNYSVDVVLEFFRKEVPNPKQQTLF
ncbi:MAG: hypothetical protein ACYDEJ_06650 [Desulfitobacteriaceae bacterium]